MKRLVSLFLCFGLNASASALKCEIENAPNELVIFELNDQGVESIDYRHDVDGKTQVDRIFSRWPQIRGAFTVDYCNPNDNEYRSYSHSYSLFSLCASSQMPIGHVVFQADFNVKTGGKISFMQADTNEKVLTFSVCGN